MKKYLTILIILISAFQIVAQCRLIRMESSDTSTTIYYKYDKMSRLVTYQRDNLYDGKNFKSVNHFLYNAANKIVGVERWEGDTLSYFSNFIYNNDLIIKEYETRVKDSFMRVNTFFYNDKKQ